MAAFHEEMVALREALREDSEAAHQKAKAASQKAAACRRKAADRIHATSLPEYPECASNRYDQVYAIYRQALT
ncbi:hypothetical protein E4U34_008445 [Claviceps purpurea]|nr:hypothetical protein E4U34_008445 [Claviceps purpurea]